MEILYIELRYSKRGLTCTTVSLCAPEELLLLSVRVRYIKLRKKNDEYKTSCSTVLGRKKFFKKPAKEDEHHLLSFCNMKGLVFPGWVLSNTRHYNHHFPLSRSSPDTPQRAALSCTSAFAMLPWKHSHGIAHYRSRHLHIISERKKKKKKKSFRAGGEREISTPVWKHFDCLLLKL